MKADKIFRNGLVYTANKEKRFAEAVAITANRISFIGTAEEAEAFIGEATEVIDMNGGMLLPGMIDSHIHPPGNKLYELYDMDLNGVNDIIDVECVINDFIASNPDEEAYYGSGLNLALYTEGEEGEKGPRKERLDAICADKPIVINTNDMHSMWANSKAFEVSGVDADTPDPDGGRIERDDVTGQPWGILREKPAGSLMPEQKFSKEQKKQAILAFQDMLHSLGITGIFALPGIVDVTEEVYELASEGKLKLRVSGAYYLWPQNITGKSIEEQVDEAMSWRERFAGFEETFKITALKYGADGVVEGITAGVIEPYEEEAGKSDDYHGEFLFTDDEMKLICELGNANGFQLHVHSIGDLATRKVLDTFEAVKNKGVTGNFRNTITHLQLVADEDIPRFAELDVIAAAQPFWMKKEPVWFEKVEKAFLGERAEYQYPLKSFIDSKVIITSSSDHGVTTTPYPFIAIEGGVTRNLTTAEDYEVEDITDMDDPRYLLNRAERVTITDMLDSFTVNGAFQGFREEETGSIEEGKLADVILIDRNIFECEPVDIEKTRLLMTVFNGEIVYKRQ